MKLYRLIPDAQSSELRPELREEPDPTPAHDQVLIRVRAASLNYRDLLMKRGQSASGGAQNVIPLSDGAGEILAVGDEVEDFQPGDRVAGCFFSQWEGGPFSMAYHKSALGGSTDGMLAEQVLLPAGGVVRIPDYLTFKEAACLPCAALTAWHAIFVRGGLSEGDTVLALGTGGVSVFALQLATAAGARVIITSSSDEKLEYATNLGAWKAINYQTHPNWDEEVWALTEKLGVDHVVEVGGPGTLERSIKSVGAGGQIALIGVLTGVGAAHTSLFPLVTKNADLTAIYVGSRAMFRQMNEFLESHELRPVIDRAFPFEEAPAAYAHLESAQHFGKVVITL